MGYPSRSPWTPSDLRVCDKVGAGNGSRLFALVLPQCSPRPVPESVMGGGSGRVGLSAEEQDLDRKIKCGPFLVTANQRQSESDTCCDAQSVAER